MFTKKLKKNKIPVINRKVVQRFLFEVFQDVDCINLPNIVIEICVLFFNPTVDEWSVVLKHPGIRIDGCIIQTDINMHGKQSILLKNVATLGIHSWKFKVNLGYGFLDIGIESETADHDTSIRYGLDYVDDERTTYCCRFNADIDRCCVGSSSILSNDLIEMKLDLSNKVVTWYINCDCVYSLEIPKDNYRAGISLTCYDLFQDCPIELVSYQQTYCHD